MTPVQWYAINHWIGQQESPMAHDSTTDDRAHPPSGAAANDRRCYRCGHAISSIERIGRRDTCLHCGTDLHCCRNCSFHEPTSHNQCREPQAERQLDKEVGNFCEYFAFRTGGVTLPPSTDTARARLAELFRKKT